MQDFYHLHKGKEFSQLMKVGLLLAAFLALPSMDVCLAQEKAPQNPPDPDRAACARNLRKIHAAIQAYRRTEKNLPVSLLDLRPRFLADAADLVCPACQKIGKRSDDIAGSTDQPDAGVTYTYEFRPTPIPQSIQMGSSRTLRDWKQLQMGLIGGGVPIVRCHCHELSVNLSFDGDVYDSPLVWEALHSKMINPYDLSHGALFAQYETVHFIIIPERRPNLPPRFLDLTRFYNASLREGWHTDDAANNLERLGSGMVTLGETDFDVRGVVQLRSSKERPHLKKYPAGASNIVVNLKVSALHFLHSTAHPVNEGTHIGSYVMHYADGLAEKMTIHYGWHLLDWWEDPEAPDKWVNPRNSAIAWAGTNRGGGKENRKVYLYESRWDNPRPGTPIVSLDFVSTLDHSGPFLLAITADTAD